MQLTSASELPPPYAAGTSDNGRPYRIGAFDKLSINVFGIQDLSQRVQADASGNISLPMIGQLEAAGKTPTELAGAIEAALRAGYVKNPQVTVNLEEAVSQVITIDGQVRAPGLYPVVGKMTLMQAVATAKGVSEFARLNDVVIFRTVNDQKMAALYDLGAIRRGVYPDPEVYASDVVYIGDSPARRMFLDIVRSAPLFVSPLVALIRS